MILFGSGFVILAVFCCIIMTFGAPLSSASDMLVPGQSLSGNQRLTSLAGRFELGFFTPGNSNNYYIGIWYATLPDHTVVWVANRDRSVSDPASSHFSFLENGNFTLLDQSNSSVWSTQTCMSNSGTAKLLDNGNFVIRDASGVILWESFDHPTDTWLPGGARLGYNNLTNQKLTLTPWKNPQDPAPGIFSLEIDTNERSFMLLYNGSRQYWNSGSWDGKIFAQVPEIKRNRYIKNISFVSDYKGSFVSYDAADPDTYIRYVIDTTGQFNAYKWLESFTQWNSFWLRPTQFCEVYGFCGASGICQESTSMCVCMEGYELSSRTEWELRDHTDGCIRKAPLQVDDTFKVVPDVRLPANPETVPVNDIDQCKEACLKNSSCTACAYDNKCLVWVGDLFNVKQFTADDKEGKDLYLKVPAYERTEGNYEGTEGKKESKTIWIVIGVLGGFVIVITIVVVLFVKHRCFGERFDTVDGSLVMFRYKVLKKATNNFSEKLGEGGFGSVFKGTLQGSTAIAVKILNCPKQVDKQFLSEVRTIGQVQHINLIRLCGFCAEASKRFLVYEYMPNGSLESVLFKNSSIVLDWKVRYQIAIGTARGLAYLHEECRECIIHCDIKPENILLDADYVPKVADFGLAKLVDRDISRIITTMKGTRGYIAPEWISGEAITSKADIFSYGMLLFELISGRRNRDLLDNALENYFPTRVANALNHEEDVDALLDYRLEGNADKEQLSRACKVACWCIQDDEKARPTTRQVVQLLEGVIQAGIPPMPKFLDRFSKSLVESINYRYITSSTSDSCCHEYLNSISEA